jgi:DNA-binding transcriptional LysR family regulator
VSLAGREADIAIRMSPPEGASLLSRALPPIALGTFASPGYLAGRDPARLDLSRERLLTYNESYGRVPELEVLRAAGLENACVAVTNSTRALLAAAVAGAGVALLPTVFARRAGLLQVRSPTFPARRPYLVTHRDLRRRRDIDAVHRWIRGSFGMALRGAE